MDNTEFIDKLKSKNMELSKLLDSKEDFSSIVQEILANEERDKNGKIKDYVIQWDLVRPKPLVDWFTVSEFHDYLEVIE